jgi:hypothetical protein
MEEEICPRCRNKAVLPFPSAFVFEPTPPSFRLCSICKEDPESLAAFAVVQWERLDWPMPDIVLSLPRAKGLARAFASLLGSFFADALKQRGEWECNTSFLEEDSLILLLSLGNSFNEINQAIEAVSDAFPKKIYVLSLYPLTASEDVP